MKDYENAEYKLALQKERTADAKQRKRLQAILAPSSADLEILDKDLELSKVRKDLRSSDRAFLAEKAKVEQLCIQDQNRDSEIPMGVAKLAVAWSFAFTSLGMVYNLLMTWLTL